MLQSTDNVSNTTSILILCIAVFPILAGGYSGGSQPEKTLTIKTPGRTLELAPGSIPPAAITRGLVVCRLAREPSSREIEALRNRGITLAGYLGDLTYWAECASGSDLSGLPIIAAAFEAEPEDKIPPVSQHLLSRLHPERSIVAEVSLAEGAGESDIIELINRVGARRLNKGVLFGTRIILELPAGSIRRVAGSDMVRLVQLTPRRKRLANSRAQ